MALILTCKYANIRTHFFFSFLLFVCVGGGGGGGGGRGTRLYDFFC